MHVMDPRDAGTPTRTAADAPVVTADETFQLTFDEQFALARAAAGEQQPPETLLASSPADRRAEIEALRAEAETDPVSLDWLNSDPTGGYAT